MVHKRCIKGAQSLTEKPSPPIPLETCPSYGASSQATCMMRSNKPEESGKNNKSLLLSQPSYLFK